jgi:hypothetical protein
MSAFKEKLKKIKEEEEQSRTEMLKDSYTPVKGVDYFTQEERQEIIDEATPTDEKLTDLITPLIPEPIPGEKGEKGDPGNNAEPIDTEQLKAEILAEIPIAPVIDETKLLKKFLAQVPKNKASLKVIQESFETDPMSVIEKIMSLPEDKFKLKSSQIDGLEQTLSSFRNQISSRGYLHGGGDTVVAGNNITIVSNSNGTKTINALGGAEWGDITGTLSNQTDLQTALDLKADKTFAIAMALALG